MSTVVNPFPIPIPANADLKRQGIPVPGSERPGQTAIYISGAFPDLVTNPYPDPRFPKTAYECFNLGLASKPTGPCLGRREWVNGDWAKEYTWETYEQVDQRRTQVGAGILELAKQGVLGDDANGQFAVGIWCPNRPEWQWVSLGTGAYSLTMVSLYDTLGPNVVEYCVNHSEVRIAFAAPTHIPALLKLAASCPTLKAIVSVDSWDSITAKGTVPSVTTETTLKSWGEEVGVTVLDINEVLALGAANPRPHVPPSPDTIASICYTSGTTGNPKGAILLHKSLASAAVTNLHGSLLKGDGVFFSFLPLSHIYERFCEDVAFAAGAATGYSCGDNLRLLEDMGILKPTFIVMVPRVLNRIYQAIKANTVDAPGLKGKIARKAFSDKLYNLEHKGTYLHPVWDKLLFSKIRGLMGGRVEFIGSGSAPIAKEVLAFLKVALCCAVTEGYGQTENCGTAVRCWDADTVPAGTVGPPAAGAEIKLIDVPDMGYFSTDKPYPRGEILTRGVMVIPGYYKDEAKSKETVDSEGWLHSGDIGLIDEFGRTKIIDRIKNLVKLSQGEYVALEKIENIYSLCPLIAQIYVHGDGLEDHVVGMIVPDPVQFAPFVSRVLGGSYSPTDIPALEKVANDPKVIAALGKELAPYAKNARLLKYEVINEDIYIHLDPFTAENDLLTPTFKTKRNVAAARFKDQLRKLYDAKPKKAAKL